MRVLIVASAKRDSFAPFIIEQVDSLRALGVEIDYFGVIGKGIIGYLKCLPSLKHKIQNYNPDIIHAHYGLSGLLANLQRKVKVVTTYHGSDIHSGGWLLALSRVTMRLSAYNIFVSEYLYNLSCYKSKHYIIQACGLDLDTIKPHNFQEARDYFGWDKEEKIVLFSGSFSNGIKNSTLAQKAIEIVDTKVQLIELKGYSRQEVSLLMSGCNCLLLTSFREASPTVIKEAMACNRPIVSTDVGDVNYVIGNTEGCYICDLEANDCAEKINMALTFSAKHQNTNGRERLVSLGLDSKIVAKTIYNIYQKIIEI